MYVRYHDSAFVMLLRLIVSVLVSGAVVLILDRAGLSRFDIRVVGYIAMGLFISAEIIYRGRRDADADIQREKLSGSTGVDPIMARYESRAAKELQQLKDGTRKPK